MKRAKPTRSILSAAAFQAAITAHPEFCLTSFSPIEFRNLAMRTSSGAPQPGVVLDAGTCSCPFPSRANVPSELIGIIGVERISLHLNGLMSALSRGGQTPAAVLVPVASVAGASKKLSPLSALYLQDDTNGGGWVVCDAYWEFQSARSSARVALLAVGEPPADEAITAWPPPHSLGARSSVPGTIRPAPSDTAFGEPAELRSTLNRSNACVSASSFDGPGLPAPPHVCEPGSLGEAAVPWAHVAPGVASVLALSGSAIADEELLQGAGLADALAAHPHLSLMAYNDAPTIDAERCASAILRTVVSQPTSGAVICAAQCTAPILGYNVPSWLAPVFGLLNIHTPWANARNGYITSCEQASVAPVSVLVPISLPGAEAGDCSAIAQTCSMLYIPDKPAFAALASAAPTSTASVPMLASHGSGWLVFENRFIRGHLNMLRPRPRRRSLPQPDASPQLGTRMSDSTMAGAVDAARLAGYNARPTILAAQLPDVVIRCAGTPSATGLGNCGDVVDEGLCAAPFVGTDVPVHLIELLQVR